MRLPFVLGTASIYLAITAMGISSPEAEKTPPQTQEVSGGSRSREDLHHEIWALPKSKDPSAFDKLKRYACDNDDFTRKAVAVALRRMSTKESFDLLVTLSKDKDPQVRGVAAYSVGHRRDARSYEVLAEMIEKDESNEVKGQAAFALASLHDEQSREKLLDCLNSPLVRVREMAAHALEQKQAQGAIEPLMKALLDPAKEVRRAAGKSLAKITGREDLYEKTIGKSAEEAQGIWQDWWSNNKDKVIISPRDRSKAGKGSASLPDGPATPRQQGKISGQSFERAIGAE